MGKGGESDRRRCWRGLQGSDQVGIGGLSATVLDLCREGTDVTPFDGQAFTYYNIQIFYPSDR